MITTRKTTIFLLHIGAFVLVFLGVPRESPAQSEGLAGTITHAVAPGDTWAALAIRYSVNPSALNLANPHPNPVRNPTIGDTVQIPEAANESLTGTLYRDERIGLLQLAVITNASPGHLARTNNILHPHWPLFGRAIFVPGGETMPRDLPHGFRSLELSAIPAQPGWPLAFRAQLSTPATVERIEATLGSARFESFVRPVTAVGVGGTGAFFAPGAPELSIVVNGQYLWSQPWRMDPGVWAFDQITLTGEAAAIDQAAIAAERARMFELWSQVTPEPLWTTPFRTPIDDFLGISSAYGARRSYNGGPYSTYHEGVDFSAYYGTPVYASGAGNVVLAEKLYVRGGAVVLDHGLGIFSGYYHMSEVSVQPGQAVEAGDLLGAVGSEGLSSGNHLHWDLLVAGTWVDAQAWQGIACWILEGWGSRCSEIAP